MAPTGSLPIGRITIPTTPIMKTLAIQTGTDRTMYVIWSWDGINYNQTSKYNIAWEYDIGNGIWLDGGTQELPYLSGGNRVLSWTFSAPTNATKVRVRVQAVSKVKRKATKKKKATYYFGGSDGLTAWPSWISFTFPTPVAPPVVPDIPSVPKIEPSGYSASVYVDNYDTKCTHIMFEVDRDSILTILITRNIEKINNRASRLVNLDPGSSYRARARGYNNTSNQYSGWSEWSESVTTPPNTPSIISCSANSSTSVKLEWKASYGIVTGYVIEYSENQNYFDTGGTVSSVTIDKASTIGYITGLETGKTWYFRVKATNSGGSSTWSSISYTTIGSKPSAPTIYSNTSTAMLNEDIILYWIHNTQDNSNQTAAEIYLDFNGSSSTIPITGSTNSYTLPKYTTEGKIRWRIRTKGIMASDDYWSDWSVEKEINIYSKPSLTIQTSMTIKDDTIFLLESYPLNIKADVAPLSQKAIGYVVSIIANNSYNTVNSYGDAIIISKGQELYSKYIEVNSSDNNIEIDILPKDVNLVNDQEYILELNSSMDSGLIATNSLNFTVGFTGSEGLAPYGYIQYYPGTLSAMINPVCYKSVDDLSFNEDAVLSVYRREYDGSFTEIATGITNSQTWVPDPHPALDYARYRIVAESTTTGNIEYYDIDDYYIGFGCVVIQWDESWKSIPTYDEDADVSDVLFAGNMLKFPYNIDVSNSNDVDVSLIEYIGREHPVSYYGTQKGEGGTWNVEFDKSDTETLHTLRRLAAWTGDVYVREPSGSGYWAQINVSFSLKHTALTVPVTFTIKRVEGGM